jgi:hypothetical protein
MKTRFSVYPMVRSAGLEGNSRYLLLSGHSRTRQNNFFSVVFLIIKGICQPDLGCWYARILSSVEVGSAAFQSSCQRIEDRWDSLCIVEMYFHALEGLGSVPSNYQDVADAHSWSALQYSPDDICGRDTPCC